MRQANATFWEASLMSGLSQLQLWILVQNKIIKSTITYQEIKIDMCRLREWIITHNRMVYQLQLGVDERDIRFSVKNCIEKCKKQKNRR